MNMQLSKFIGAFLLLIASSFTTAHAAACGNVGDNLDTGDVTFRGSDSDDCGGIFAGNDSLAEVNSAVNNLLFGGTNWSIQLKDDNPGAAPDGTGSLLGVDWTLSADAGIAGDWTLTVADPGATDLPVTVDFLAVLKASTGWAAYFFEAETFNVIGGNLGTFAMKILNNGGNIADISHLSLYLREGVPTDPDDPNDVPEPTSLLLLSIGLLGFFGTSRKKS